MRKLLLLAGCLGFVCCSPSDACSSDSDEDTDESLVNAVCQKDASCSDPILAYIKQVRAVSQLKTLIETAYDPTENQYDINLSNPQLIYKSGESSIPYVGTYKNCQATAGLLKTHLDVAVATCVLHTPSPVNKNHT